MRKWLKAIGIAWIIMAVYACILGAGFMVGRACYAEPRLILPIVALIGFVIWVKLIHDGL